MDNKTDLETMVHMIDKAHLEYEFDSTEKDFTYISIEAGYVGFITYITFDKQGSLISIKAYE